MTFDHLKKQVADNFKEMSKHPLFYVTIDRDEIWNQYLSGFPDEERQEHNCNCCKSFLRQYAGIVAIIGDKMVSMWDGIDATGYQQAIDNVNAYIHSLPITDVFVNEWASCGTDKNFDTKREVTWTHFHINLPAPVVVRAGTSDTLRGQRRDDRNVLKRSLDEITIDATETALELIGQGSLYRGNEQKGVLEAFLKLQKKYKTAKEKELFAWQAALVSGSLSRIRNTAIGTLLVNLSEGIELDMAVGKWEQVMAPSNYKRPTALVTPAMVAKAKETLEGLGLLESMDRRYAEATDLNVEDILFTDKSSAITDVFGEISKEQLVNPRTLSKVEEITMEDFIKNVVPTAKSIELLVENRHSSNMMSLLTSQAANSPSLFKWDNNFSWSYSGGMADSMKERVAALGGRVDGVFRFSHSWNEIEPNQSLMDLHVFMPGNEHSIKTGDTYGSGRRVGWNHRSDSASGGNQDVDYVVEAPKGHVPVENITFPSINKMPEGKYICRIHNWHFRGTGGKGKAEIEVGGVVYQYEYPRTRNKEWITIAEVTLKDGVFTVEHAIPENTSSKKVWGINTNQWTKVTKFMLSPNHWGRSVGNKHYMFLLENCLSDESPRPFYNEMLKTELDTHRKVFEIIGSKLKIEPSANQLSGIGFSDTQDNHVYAKVTGTFSRVLKVKI